MKKLSKPIQKIPTVRAGLNIGTISDMLERSAENYKDSLAFLTPRKGNIYRLSYGQALERVRRLSRYLKDELGLGRGDHIAILGGNSPEWAISYFSIAYIGAVAIPLDVRASADSYESILGFSSAKAIILSGSHLPYIHSIENGLKHVILMESLDEICNKYSNGVNMENVSSHDVMEILFTSGTTGDPKGVILTHGNIMSNVDDVYKIIDFTKDDMAFSILPIHHCYECTMGLLTPFCNGMSVFYARSLKPNEMIEDLKTAHPTMWLNTPLILEKLLLRINRELTNQKGINRLVTKLLPKKSIGNRIKQKLGLDRIRLIVSGGAALSTWVSNGLEELGFPILQGYGLSEASPLISVNPPSKPSNTSIGMIIPSDEVEIRDIDAEGNGEIAVRGPNIMKGYYRNENATKEVLTPDDWFMTGDIGYFDEEGYLYMTGRKKFVIVTKGGKNVFPEEIEEKLTKSAYIEEALVFSLDDKIIQAVIYPNLDKVRNELESFGNDLSDDNIWELIRSHVKKVNETLEYHKKISCFALRLEEFPKTTTRKIKRHLFRALYLKSGIKVIRD